MMGVCVVGNASKIEWTDASWTPIRARNLKTGKVGWHCEHATTGCEFCYAEGMNKRLGTGLPFKPGHRKDIEIFLDEEMLLAPLRWKKPRMIFVCSMTDAFAEFVTDEMLDKMFAVMDLCPQHTFQVLTKRAERMLDYCARHAGVWCPHHRCKPLVTNELIIDGGYGRRGPLPNVWLGVSAERQQEADERIPLLLQTPAAVRFISAEPLLGAIDLSLVPRQDGISGGALTVGAHRARESREWIEYPRLDWVIVGGESGSGARPMHPDWARSLRNQCAAAGVPFFFKQWGEWAQHKVEAGGDLGGDVRAGRVKIMHPTGQTDVEVSETTGGRSTIPGSLYMARVGKKRAGRLLDGKEHNAFPQAKEVVSE